jgi:hypothetical protein
VIRVRLSLALLLAAVGLAAAACGGGGGGGGGSTAAGGELPAGASVVPASAPILVSVDSDFESEQWKQATALARHFPGLPDLLGMLQAQLAKQNVSFDQDVKPALGPEVDVAFLDLQNGGNNVVVLTKPKDKGKLDALLAKGESPAATTEKDGWTVAADSQAKIGKFEQGGGTTLANDQEFQSVMKRLPADTLARAYVAGAPVQALAESSVAQSSGQSGLTSGFGTLKGLALAATAKENGLRLDGAIDGTVASPPDSYKAELPSDLPTGALLFVSFNQLDKQLRRVLAAIEKTQPNLQTQLSQIEAASGISLENDVFPLLSGEGAVAVYPTTGALPTIEVVLRVPDEDKAKSFVDRLGAIARLAGQTVQDVDVSGVAAHEIDLSAQNLTLFYAVFDGKLVVTNTRDGIAGFRSSGARLEDDPLYKEAADAAELPDETVGYFYADLRDGLPLVFQLARSRGSTIPPAVDENTKPLDAALLYVAKADEGARLGGFVTVK